MADWGSGASGAMSGAATGTMVAPGIGTLIGGGIGLLGGLFGGKKKPATSTTAIDPESQDYIRNQRGMAQFFAGRQMPTLDPNVMAAIAAMQKYSAAGQQGLDAVTGAPGAQNRFMNPYMEAMNPIFDRMRQESLSRVNASLTAPGGGAFAGNNRVGLAQGAAMNGVNDSQAQFNFQGFNDAMARAMSLANNGIGVNDWLKNTGFDLTNRQRNWDIGSLGLMNGGFGQPLSTTTTGQPGQQGTNMFQSILGGAMAGSSFGGGGRQGPGLMSGGFNYPDPGQGFGPATPGQVW